MSYLNKLWIGTMTTLVVVAGALLSGCAGVTFYSESTLDNKTGIPIYAPKPYLLVARTGAKDKPLEVSIVYLNDPNKVIYAKPHSGLGSSNLTLALANGQMTSFGQQTDTKVPELIAALGGLITSSATASKTAAEAAQIRSSIGTKQAAVSPVEAGKKIGVVVDDMLAKISANTLPGLTDAELQTVKSAAQALKSSAMALSNPANVPSATQYFDQVKAQTDSLSKLPAPTASTPRDSSLQMVQAWAAELGKIFDSAQPEKETPQAFELYEIIQGNGTSTLRRVNL
ncbi:MAG: hypothetical protein ACYDBT_07200 [Desulfobulbaceae bacterium]